MTVTITRIVEAKLGPYAELSCGHSARCETVPQGYECMHCDTRSVHNGPCRGCGRRAYRCFDIMTGERGYTDRKNPINWVSYVGQHVDSCPHCDSQRQAMQVIDAALAEGKVAHTRADADGAGRLNGRTLVYQRDTTMPRGVCLLATLDDSPASVKYRDKVLRGGLSPLSPTEGR